MAEYLGNFRRKKAKELLAKGATVSAALRGAGYAESTAKSQPSAIVGPIKRDLAAALERKGLTDDKFADMIWNALHARDEVFFSGQEIGTSTNWPARLQAIRFCGDVRGDDAPKELKHSGTVNLTVEEIRSEQRSVWSRLQALE